MRDGRERKSKSMINISRKISKAEIIVGGSFVEPTLNHIYKYLEADYYVRGEGEETIRMQK